MSYLLPAMAAVGTFELIAAVKVKPGDKMVVTLADKQQGGTIFAVVKVEKVELVSADGLYLPVIEEPYLVVDGVVMPL